MVQEGLFRLALLGTSQPCPLQLVVVVVVVVSVRQGGLCPQTLPGTALQPCPVDLAQQKPRQLAPSSSTSTTSSSSSSLSGRLR